MNVEFLRLFGEPFAIHVGGDATVERLFSTPGSGRVLGDERHSLLEAAERRYGSLDQLGMLRVDGAAATLETRVAEGSTVLIIPKVVGAARRGRSHRSARRAKRATASPGNETGSSLDVQHERMLQSYRTFRRVALRCRIRDKKEQLQDLDYEQVDADGEGPETE
jgi:molybdopterin converting factor small subunit